MSKRPDVLFLLQPSKPRRRFIVGHVLRSMLGWNAQEVNAEEARSIQDVPLLVMGGEAIPGTFHVAAMPEELEPVSNKDPKRLFPSPDDDLGFDLFATAFYFLSLSQE